MVITGTLGADDFELEKFKHYYDKDSNILNLKSNSSLDSIIVYNIIGQQVLTKKLSQSEEAINLSQINDGIYIAKIEAGNTYKTIKFLKQ